MSGFKSMMRMIEWIFMICFVLLQFVSGNHQIRCIQREREALLQFKSSLVDDYHMLSSWNTNDCCQWKGIRCTNLTGGHILMLDLHGSYDDDEQFFLSGEIQKSLMELQQLQYLNLSGNDFEGSHIPHFFASLTNLAFLDLSNSYFGGNIPTQFGSLSHLKYLNLAQNDLEGSIPYQLGNLSNLQHLDLRANSLEGNIPSQLGKLSNLQMLYLGGYNILKIDDGNHVRGQWLSNLTSLTHLYFWSMSNLNTSYSWMQMIGKLPHLRELSLYDCSLSDHFILSLRPFKFNFSTSLSTLDLSENTFTSSMIFEWVSNVTSNLVELDLSYNYLEGSTINHFGIEMNSFMNICTLHSLNLAGNNLNEDLPSILHNLSDGCVRDSLQELDLSYNQIIGSLPDISVFSSLKTLHLSYNKLNGKILEGSKLPSQLESLSISSNSLEGGVPKSLGSSCSLTSLYLSYNSLSDDLSRIIHHLSGCARYSLQQLYLRRNHIRGTLPNLSIFTSLKELNLDDNKLDGTIPNDLQFPIQLETLSMMSNSLKGVLTDHHFTNLSKLNSLDLANNSLTLAFTENWVPPFQLNYLSLGSCKLGSTFPKWLRTQNNIAFLDISNCGISGVVPEWFWTNLMPLQDAMIDISYNNLTGKIPNLPLKNTYESLILASNRFEGPIPPFLRGFMMLDLSKNKFSNFESFLCAKGKIETLGQLDLSNNQLFGRIPNCWNHFKSLAYLDLSHNNLSGKIPTSIGSLLELQALILRNNSLSGEIPFSLSSCTKLVMLDAGENKLLGPVPSWIGSKLKGLQILSLKRNHFFGSLPVQLCYLQSIQLLDLSFNNLSGQIPKCLNNFTSMAQDNSSKYYESHQYFINSGPRPFSQTYTLNALLMWKEL
ncbi:hypothetical protein VNO77_33660 [Canavalia gladiata]|uniref:Uncharacterized protein n=1 Tax=Canavalia gladiata TaxID=3824 RepID=A0AAN9KED1_CANGL